MRGVGAFIHWLPVNQEFTLEASRTIWGFPKEIADIPMDLAGRVKRCAVRFGGRTAIEVAVKPGVPMPSSTAAPKVDAYSCMDGVTRRTPLDAHADRRADASGRGEGRPGRPPGGGGAAGAWLDRARALSTSTVGHLQMVFDGAEEVRR